jgi:hypothetical protein
LGSSTEPSGFLPGRSGSEAALLEDWRVEEQPAAASSAAEAREQNKIRINGAHGCRRRRASKAAKEAIKIRYKGKQLKRSGTKNSLASVSLVEFLSLRSLGSLAANPVLRRPPFAVISSFKAVAENQPGKKNRVSSINAFSGFAARLRYFIDSRAGEFNALALELFALQFEHNEPYRRFCKARRAGPKNVARWDEIPALPTSALKEWELSCLPPEQRTAVFRSSGTTEQRPSRHFHGAVSLEIYEASLWTWFARHVVPDLKSEISDFRLAILTPPPPQAPHSSLAHMFDTVRRKLAAPESSFLGRVRDDGAWRLDSEAALKFLRQASSTGVPVILLGTAFSFVHLLDYLAEHDLCLKLPPGSRALETGGYKGRSRTLPKQELHALVTRRLGIPPLQIVCEYGMSELSSQAYDNTIHASRITHHASPLFRFPPWARAKIVSPETGREVSECETGLIRVFDLANVYSVEAIQTEDLGVRHGDGFELIGRAAFAESRGCSLMAV